MLGHRCRLRHPQGQADLVFEFSAFWLFREVRRGRLSGGGGGRGGTQILLKEVSDPCLCPDLCADHPH